MIDMANNQDLDSFMDTGKELQKAIDKGEYTN